MAEGLTSVEIFCCCAREDERWLRRLEKHLSLFQRQGLISLWHDRLIAPGTDWAKTIDSHLETASIILLLVSANFFTSDYCYGLEMKRAMVRQEADEARVVPILVRPVNWADAPFAHFQVLPTNAKPIVSWQDKDAALTNIVTGIRRMIVEELPLFSVKTPHGAWPKIWNIPYPRNPFFLGRESELAQVRQQLQANQTMALSQPQAISGLGGIGKTQLALEYAYRYHQDYLAVLWVRAESAEALISSYIALAALLQLPKSEAKEQDISVEAVKTWLQTHNGWLLILDNADELALLPDFLPPVWGGHLLLTTRATATGHLAQRLEVETLSSEQGALFLLRRSRLVAPDAVLEQILPRDRELAMQISQELGGLPLALDQAGAYLEETRTDLTDYWQIYRQHRAALLRERRGLVADHPEPVATTWSLSFQRVEERNLAAAKLLHLCAFLSPDAIPEEILTVGALFLGPVLAPVASDAFRRNQAIEVLQAYSLVHRNPREKSLSIHRLVQAVLQDAMGEVERRFWAERAVFAVNAAFPHVEHSVWSQCDRLLPHAMLAVRYIDTDHLVSKEVGRLLYEVASYFQDHARYPEAELLFRQALDIFEQQLGLEHPQVTSTLHGLADTYRDQEKDAEAEPLYQEALRMIEQQVGATHPDVIYPLHGLAHLYTTRGEYELAEALYQRALSVWEHQLGETHPDGAHLLKGLAKTYSEQGKYELAETFYQRALYLWEQQLGEMHPSVAYPLKGLADLYSEQGKYELAETFYQRALSIREQTLGMYHPKTTETRKPLIMLFRTMGQQEKAAQLEEVQSEQ